MMKTKVQVKIILQMVLFLIIIQAFRAALSQIYLQLAGKTLFSCDCANLLASCFLTIGLLLAAKKRSVCLSVFPSFQNKKERYIYIGAAVLALLLFAFSPTFTADFSAAAVVALLFSVIVTPIFEELVFRGYIWNRLKSGFDSEFKVYVINTLLFALWHLGYADTIWFRISYNGLGGNLPYIMAMKVVTGLCFGIVLGFIRYKTKNCLASMLAHGVMNLFGR